jgi:hypothetical protein
VKIWEQTLVHYSATFHLNKMPEIESYLVLDKSITIPALLSIRHVRTEPVKVEASCLVAPGHVQKHENSLY